MPAKTKYVKLEDCKKCKKHRGVSRADYAKCELHGDGTIATALIAPSNHNPGIKNGVLVVRCHDVE